MKTHSPQTTARVHSPLAVLRRPVAGLALATALISASVCRGAGDGPAPLDDITAAYQKQRQSVRTFLVEYELRSKGLVEMPVLSKHLNTAYFLNEDVTLAAKGDLRYYHYVGHYKNQPGGQLLLRTVVYDGKVLKEKRPLSGKAGPEIVMVQAVRKLDTLYFPNMYTGAVCFTSPDPGEKQSGNVTARDRIPEMFKTGTFVVAQQKENVDGADCVVVAAEGRQKLWLDPQKGYVVRKRELYNKDGEHTFTIHCREFESVTPDLWLPRHVTWLTIGPKTAPEEYRGKPLLQTDVQVRRLEVNQPAHDALFEFKVPPGTQVVDETITGEDTSKLTFEAGQESPTISYIQPVNDADLESVIAEAKARHEQKEPVGRRNLFLIINGVLLAVVASAFVAWWLIRRRRAATTNTTGTTGGAEG
jgi:hypothetical protein